MWSVVDMAHFIGQEVDINLQPDFWVSVRLGLFTPLFLSFSFFLAGCISDVLQIHKN